MVAVFVVLLFLSLFVLTDDVSAFSRMGKILKFRNFTTRLKMRILAGAEKTFLLK